MRFSRFLPIIVLDAPVCSTCPAALTPFSDGWGFGAVLRRSPISFLKVVKQLNDSGVVS